MFMLVIFFFFFRFRFKNFSSNYLRHFEKKKKRLNNFFSNFQKKLNFKNVYWFEIILFYINEKKRHDEKISKNSNEKIIKKFVKIFTKMENSSEIVFGLEIRVVFRNLYSISSILNPFWQSNAFIVYLLDLNFLKISLLSSVIPFKCG